MKKATRRVGQLLQSRVPTHFPHPDSAFVTSLSTQGLPGPLSAASPLLLRCEALVELWLEVCGRVLAGVDNEARLGGDDAGPLTELQQYKAFVQELHTVRQHLRAPPCRMVVAVLSNAGAPVIPHWRAMEAALADTMADTQDTLKYLGTLERHMEALYSGSPAEVLDVLPALLYSVRMMCSVAKQYSAPEHMATLFIKISNQVFGRDAMWGPRAEGALAAPNRP